MDEPLPDELSLLGEHLHTIAAAFAHVDETVTREVNAVQGRRKLRLVGRRTRNVVVGRRVVVDLAQGNSLAAPSALERARIHVVDENPLVEKPIRDKDLACVLIELERANAGREHRRLLVVLLHLVGRHLGTAMAEVLQELAVPGELDDAVAGRRPGQPDVLLTVDGNGLQSARASRDDSPARPTRSRRCRPVEFEDLGPEHAALAARGMVAAVNSSGRASTRRLIAQM